MREVLGAAAVRQWCRLAADALGRTRGEIDALNPYPPKPDRQEARRRWDGL